MASKDCIDRIKQASAGELDDDSVADLTDQLGRLYAERRRLNPMESPQDSFAAIGKDLAKQEEIKAIIEKRSRAINVLRKQDRFKFLSEGDRRQVHKAYSDLLVGSQRYALGVDQQYHGIKSPLQGGLIDELRQGGLLDILSSRDEGFDRDVSRELFRIDQPDAADTGNAAAKKVAAIIAKYQETARKLQNDAGAWIGKLPGYIVSQTHDAVAILSAGFDRWRETIEPRLSEATFDGVKAEDRTEFLHAIYDGISTGIHNRAEGSGDWLTAFKGPSNLAKKVSQNRKLIFKDADSWYDYNQQFGKASLFEAVHHGLDRAARNTALMNVFGTNPQAAFDADLTQLTKQYRSDPQVLEGLQHKRLQDQFHQVNGTANKDGIPSKARFHANVRAVISMSKLGGVVLSSFPDVAVIASTLRHNGVSYFDGIGAGLGSIVRGRGSAAQREILDAISAGVEGIKGDVFDRFGGANEGVAGTMSHLMQKFFKANLLTWWTDSMKSGVGLMLSKNLADMQARDFGGLHPLLQQNLKRYGIGEKEWDIYRRLDTKVADGQSYMTADALHDLTDDQVKDYLGKPDAKAGTIRQTRQALTTKLNTYYADQIMEAMNEPGARQRAAYTFGTSSGTNVGEAVRYLMQFKAYGLTFANKQIGREWSRGAAVDKTGLFALIAGTTSLGYLSMTAKEMLKGKNPRTIGSETPTSDFAKIIGAAMVQGGGLGIYGDFLFGEYNRMGQGALETLGGPAVGTVSDTARLFQTFRDARKEGDLRSAPAAAFRLGLNNTPFLNIFYTRMAMDYLILNRIQDSISPGFLARVEKNTRDQNNQTYWLPPSSYLGHP